MELVEIPHNKRKLVDNHPIPTRNLHNDNFFSLVEVVSAQIQDFRIITDKLTTNHKCHLYPTTKLTRELLSIFESFLESERK